MRSKYLLAVTLLLPFVTTLGVTNANAGRTYSHWQKSARLAAQGGPNVNAQAYYPNVNAQAYYYGSLAADPYATLGPILCTYQGGPKTNTWACR
jgi:hypothetical protein